MNYPQYPQQYPQPAPQGYGPQQYPQPPMQGYGPQPQYSQYPQPQMPPAPVAERWTGGAAFDATPQNYEKRPSLSFKGAPVGTGRLLICDMDPSVIHGKKYGLDNVLDYDAKGNPKWTVGTGYIDEYGQKVTHWCGKWSNAAIGYTSARTAVGLGPEDSMKGWIIYIQYTGDAPASVGEAKQYNIILMPLDQGRQYLTAAQIQAAQAEGIQASEPPGNLKCASQPAATQPPVHTPAQPPMQPPAPMQPTYQPPMPTYQPPMQQPPMPGMPPAAPGWPPTAQQAPAGPSAPSQPPTYGTAPQTAPYDPMNQAVHTVQGVLGGQPISQPPAQPPMQPAPQRPPTEISGYKVDALAAYATMPDAVLASTGHDVTAVRMAIQQARQIGALPQVGGQNPPQ